MLWHTGMACGVHLGAVWICVLLAEHVCCLWATQAQSSQRQNGDRYVGFSQQNGILGRVGGSHLQNPSARSSGTNTRAAVSRGLSPRLSSSSYTQTLSQPAQSGHTSVRLVQSSSPSKPNWRLSKSNAQKVPKTWFAGLSTTIAGVSSFSKQNQDQNRLTDVGRRPSPVLQSPSSKWELAAQDSRGAAAETQSYDGQRRHSPKKSSPFSSGPPSSPQGQPVRMQTSATAPGRRVSSHRRSKPSQSPTLQSERTGSNGQTEARKQAWSHASHGPSLPIYRQNGHADPQPHGLVRPTRLGLSHRPGSSSGSFPQASWNSGNPTEEHHDLPASGNRGGGTSGRPFAPTRIYSIPHRFGGYAIKRLAEPSEQKEGRVGKAQPAYRVPPQPAYRVPPQPANRVPPQSANRVPAQPANRVPAQPANRVPAQPANRVPAQPAYRVPAQPAYRVPAQPAYRVPAQPAYRVPAQPAYRVPPQQVQTVPPQRRVSVKPQVQSVHPEAKWKRVRPSWSLKVHAEDVRG